MVTGAGEAAKGRANDGPTQRRDGADKPLLHRIREVRLREGVSMRTAARHTGVGVRRLRYEEQGTTDLRISDLRRWQQALDVPLSELLVEPGPDLSPPVRQRAQLIRLMKTVRAIQERAASPAVRRLADNAVEQLCAIMPELRDVAAWPEYGQRRGPEECGRIAERPVPEDWLGLANTA